MGFIVSLKTNFAPAFDHFIIPTEVLRFCERRLLCECKDRISIESTETRLHSEIPSVTALGRVILFGLSLVFCLWFCFQVHSADLAPPIALRDRIHLLVAYIN